MEDDREEDISEKCRGKLSHTDKALVDLILDIEKG